MAEADPDADADADAVTELVALEEDVEVGVGSELILTSGVVVDSGDTEDAEL